MSQVVTTLTVDARGAEAGTALFIRQMDAAQAASDRVLQAERKTAEARERGTLIAMKSADSITAISRRWTTLSASIDPAVRATQAIERAQLLADAAFRAGVATQAEAARAVDLVRQKHDLAAGAANDNATAFALLAQRAEAFSRAVDPAYAAQSRFNAAVEEAEDLYTAGAISLERYRLGLAKAAADMSVVTQAGARQALAQRQGAQDGFNRQLGVRTDFGTDARGEDIAAYGAALDAVRAKYDPLFAAQQRYRASLTDLRDARKVGAIDETVYAARLAETKQAFAEQIRVMNGTATATDGLTRAHGLARHELINLSRQAQDVVVSLSSGQDVMTVLIQQGSQVADVFSSSEGTVSGFFRQVGGWLVRIAPWAAAAAAAMTALYSAISVAGERRQLDTSLLGSGRGVGLTGGQFDQLAKASADTAQITVSNARQIAAEYARLGQLAATQLPQLTRLTKDYALITGQGMTDAARELATAFADPSRGAEQLAGKVGNLDSVTVRSIRTAEMYGDRLRAQKLLIDGLAQSMDGASNAQSKWDRFVEQYVSRPVDRTKNAIAERFLPPELTERLERNRQAQAAMQRTLDNAIPGDDSPMIRRTRSDLATLQERAAAIDAEIQKTQALAKARGEANEANRKIAGAETVSREVRPFGPELQELEKRNRLLQESRDLAEKNATATLLDHSKPLDNQRHEEQLKQLADLEVALKVSTQQLNEYREAQSAGSIEADKAARAQEIQKRYLGQVSAESKAALAAELALNDARGSTMTAAERQASAERARIDAIIQTTRAQEEAKRASNDNMSSLEAQAKAAKSVGSEFAEAARLRKEAEQFAERNGGNAEEIYQRRLAERLAEVNKELAVKTAQTRESAAVENAVNGRSGNLSETERAQLLQRQNALMQERQRLLAAGATDQAAVNAKLDEYGRALDSVVSAQTRARAQGMVFGQREQIAALEQEVALIWQSADVRERLVAVMRAEQELKRQGIPLTSAEGQAYVANAATIAGLNTVKDSLVDIQSLGRDALKGFIGDLRAGKSGAEALQNALSRVLDKMLDMALNSLFGSKGGFNLGSLFGSWFGGNGTGGSSGGSGVTDVGGTAGFWPFASGGYTGAGGKYEPAGVVHRGEYVFSKAATDYLGVGNLESLHRQGKRGYADGGHVGMPANSNAPAAANSNRSTRVNVQIINQTSGEVEGEAEQVQNSDGSTDTIVRLVESRMGQRAGRGQGSLSAATRARAANKHLQG